MESVRFMMATMAGDLFGVDGKVVIITGGLGQLGVQFGKALLERGARVAALDLKGPVARAHEAFSGWLDVGTLLCLEADVTDRSSLVAALEKVEGSLGTPSGLINAAAIDAPPGADSADNAAFEEYSERAWTTTMNVNVTGTFLACQVFGAPMAAAGSGSIINISSIYGLVAPDQRIYEYRRRRGEDFHKPIGYAASKSAILNFSRYLAVHWAAKGVRVNTVTFGGVWAAQDPEFVEAYAFRAPLGRMARPDEYEGPIVFLLSEASSYMTGANLVVDGGWTAW
jgi:NAD(P)-dependent dehydrogenase (short-subunit alcohol dehydrogenase family)